MSPKRLKESFAAVLKWSPVDKALLGAGLVLPFVCWYTAVAGYLLEHTDVAGYINRDFLKFQIRCNAFLIAGWATLIAVGLIVRRRRPMSGAFVHVTANYLAVQAVFASYVGGHHTSPLMGIILLAGATFGLLLFETRLALPAISTYVIGVIGTTIAEQAGLIRYAPLLSRAPYANGSLEQSWMVGAGAIHLVGLLSMLMVIYFVMDRMHDRERRLASTSEQLARAIDVISRYVAGQITAQIRAGNYAVLDSHDRRRLTIFFSDIKDFSDVADSMEPEDLSRVLNEYLSAMTEIAERHGGMVDKFVGDAIMVLFGAPVPSGDSEQAISAVRMAVEMQERIGELRRTWTSQGFEEGFHVRMGINTGLASVGNFGSSGRVDYTAIGRQVNLAARFQARCAPDKILIGHSTWSLVHADIACSSIGEIEVKGAHRPVKVYEVDVEEAH